jgi:hypothetical protein
MLTNERMRLLTFISLGVVVLGFLCALYGYAESESDPEDRERQELYGQAFQAGDISVVQKAQGASLEAIIPRYAELRPDRQRVYGQERWDRMRQQMFRFVAAVNQGLGDPFEYPKPEDADYPKPGEPLLVKGVKPASLKYQNPYEAERPLAVTTPISSSQEVARRRRGWRIVSKDLALFLRPGVEEPVEIGPGARFVAEVGSEFLIASGGDPDSKLRISLADPGPTSGVSIELRAKDGGRKKLGKEPLQHGSFFVWDKRSFAVFRTDVLIKDAADEAIGDLVFTKMVNGQRSRVQVLGRATANLIGSRVGGSTPYIDGAFRHGSAQRLVLTLDPELQSAASFLLHSALDRLSAYPTKMAREREGALSILDAETGHVLAHAGAPGYDPLWEGRRIILANRDSLIGNPANHLHMPGSAVKVLTAGAGYLLFGEGAGQMLPESVNRLAIRQAFRNAYGGPMPPENVVENKPVAAVTADGEDYFRKHGGKGRLSEDFKAVLDAGFNVLVSKPDSNVVLYEGPQVRKQYYEGVVPGTLSGYFNAAAMFEFLPERSRFPVRDAESMAQLRQYAIGASEARFTTLRLAAILGTTTSGRPMFPTLVEAVFDAALDNSKDQRAGYSPESVFPEWLPALDNVEGVHNGNLGLMTARMRTFLREVCDGAPGTGWYFDSTGRKKIYMTADNPETALDEAASRRDDFGKTGTADYAELDDFNDSVFVYKHGRYLIAVWLDRAEGVGVIHPAHDLLNRIVSYIERLEPTRGR